MEWLEVIPLPAKCQTCRQTDCYNCDTALDRWILSPEDELRIRRRGMEKAIERLQKQIEAIDAELAGYKGV